MTSGGEKAGERCRVAGARQRPQPAARAIRCDHDGLKMAEIQDGHLILRSKHHGETHVKVVRLAGLVQRVPDECSGRCSP